MAENRPGLEASHPKNGPYDFLAEKAFLSCLLQDSRAFDEVADLNLSKDDFYHPQYGHIYEAVSDLNTQSIPIDYITVGNRLNEVGKLAILGDEKSGRGMDFLTDIFEDQASSAHIYYYSRIVKEKSIIRQVMSQATKIIEMGRTHTGPLGDFLKEVEARFFRLTIASQSRSFKKISDCLSESLREIEALQKGEISQQTASTGLHDLDEKILGMSPGQLIIAAGRPGMGKTGLGLNLAVSVAKSQKFPVAFFSLEMMSKELTMRILSGEAQVDSRKIKTNNYSVDDWKAMGAVVADIARLPIYIDDNANMTLYDIQAQCRRLKVEQGLALIVVDYLQLLRPGNSSLPREQQISEISRGLKQLAKEIGCPVLALAQLNRSLENRTDRRPILADLRESGSIEQDADMVLFIYRDEVYNPDTPEPGIAEIIIGKNRSGEVGKVKVAWHGAYTSFYNLEHSHQDDDMPSPFGR